MLVPVRPRLLAATAAVLALLPTGCGHGPIPAGRGPAGAFPPPPRSEGGRIWAVGDADASPASRRLARLIERSRPLRLLYLGDVYESGSRDDFRRFEGARGALKPRTLPT